MEEVREEEAREEGERMAVPAGRTGVRVPMQGATTGRGVEVATSLTTSFRVVVTEAAGVAGVSDGCLGERARRVWGQVGRKIS
jgi:hypothetical protein